ncbi:MAG: hypothetical protein ACREA0_10045, partial [bacterium]
MSIECKRNVGIYELHGIGVRSELPIAALLKNHRVDVEVSWGEPFVVDAGNPGGRILAEFTSPTGSGYALAENGAGYILRFFSTCEFRIRHDLKAIRVHLDPRAEPGFASLLLAGNVLATILTLAGGCILHASAVAFGGAVLVFVGASGMGKSTLAAVLCANGGRLVTDDVLRVELANHGAFCYPGTTEIRLRPSAAPLASGFNSSAVAPTADQRIGIRLDGISSRAPVHSIVLPQPSRQTRALALRRLGARDALLRLLRYPRILGWQAPDLVSREFRNLATLVRTVPVYLAEVPWGPP